MKTRCCFNANVWFFGSCLYVLGGSKYLCDCKTIGALGLQRLVVRGTRKPGFCFKESVFALSAVLFFFNLSFYFLFFLIYLSPGVDGLNALLV